MDPGPADVRGDDARGRPAAGSVREPNGASALRTRASPDPRALVWIKLLHTAIWAVIAGAIVALPILAWFDHFAWVIAVNAAVLVEGLVLLGNRGRCPLTDVAARHTDERADNFDIYLPVWLARHNKVIFTVWVIAGDLFALWRWWG